MKLLPGRATPSYEMTMRSRENVTACPGPYSWQKPVGQLLPHSAPGAVLGQLLLEPRSRSGKGQEMQWRGGSKGFEHSLGL